VWQFRKILLTSIRDIVEANRPMLLAAVGLINHATFAILREYQVQSAIAVSTIY
jgi:hypothetical protein